MIALIFRAMKSFNVKLGCCGCVFFLLRYSVFQWVFYLNSLFNCEKSSQKLTPEVETKSMKSSRQLKLTKSGSVYFSPLALVALSACGGGGSPVTSGGGAAAAGGAVVKGPLENALVFIDYDQDGVQDVGEPSAVTSSDGSYSIVHTDTTDTTFDIVAIAGAGTIDASSGSAVEGFTLSAPSDAGVVTPATTMFVDSGGALSAADVADILNLPDGVDPLTFNPY